MTIWNIPQIGIHILSQIQTAKHKCVCDVRDAPQIAKFIGPTWGPPESCRSLMGPMLAPWTLLSGTLTLVVLSLLWVSNYRLWTFYHFSTVNWTGYWNPSPWKTMTSFYLGESIKWLLVHQHTLYSPIYPGIPVTAIRGFSLLSASSYISGTLCRIYVSVNRVSIDPGNGLSLVRRQAIPEPMLTYYQWDA